MSTSFDAIVLSGDLIPQALPLIRATWPAVDLTSWGNFVRFFAEPAPSQESGALGLRDRTGCLCGVLAYRLDQDLLAGPLLAVPLFTAVDLVNSPHTVRALLETAETRALELDCARVQIHLRNGQAELASLLRAMGLSSEIGHFWKEIDLVQGTG